MRACMVLSIRRRPHQAARAPGLVSGRQAAATGLALTPSTHVREAAVVQWLVSPACGRLPLTCGGGHSPQGGGARHRPHGVCLVCLLPHASLARSATPPRAAAHLHGQALQFVGGAASPPYCGGRAGGRSAHWLGGGRLRGPLAFFPSSSSSCRVSDRGPTARLRLCAAVARNRQTGYGCHACGRAALCPRGPAPTGLPPTERASGAAATTCSLASDIATIEEFMRVGGTPVVRWTRGGWRARKGALLVVGGWWWYREMDLGAAVVQSGGQRLPTQRRSTGDVRIATCCTLPGRQSRRVADRQRRHRGGGWRIALVPRHHGDGSSLPAHPALCPLRTHMLARCRAALLRPPCPSWPDFLPFSSSFRFCSRLFTSWFHACLRSRRCARASGRPAVQ